MEFTNNEQKDKAGTILMQIKQLIIETILAMKKGDTAEAYEHLNSAMNEINHFLRRAKQ